MGGRLYGIGSGVRQQWGNFADRAQRDRQRVAVDNAARRWPANGHAVTKGPNGHPFGGMMMAAAGGPGPIAVGFGSADGTPTNAPPDPRQTPFDRFGALLDRYPQCVTVPALFMTEFGAAMPTVSELWSQLFGVDTGSHWRSAQQLGWALPIAFGLPFILFGARALPPKAYARVKAQFLDPMAQRIRLADDKAPRRTKKGRRRPPRGELLHDVLDGGMAYGVNPYYRRHHGPRLGYVYALMAELAKSAAIYTMTGAVLDLPLAYFVPPATLLSLGANIGGAYVASIWGSLQVPAGRILAAFTCLFFTSHAISGLEAVAQQSDVIPDGIGYAGQLAIGGALSLFFIHKAQRDAAKLQPLREAAPDSIPA